MKRDEFTYEKEHVGKYVVKVYQDENADDPRELCDHIDHMVCFHRNYIIGDKHSWDKDELVKHINRKDVVALPIYIYDHSGITINTSGFSCQWDSGQIGFIYMDKKDILENWGGKKLTRKLIDKAYSYMRSSVKEFDDYITGSVYGYVVEDDEGENVESCWGFYGETKYCLEEGKAVAEQLIKNDIRDYVAKRKVQIKNHVPLSLRKPLKSATKAVMI